MDAAVKINPLELVVCETTAAITTHLRRVTSEHPISFSGFATQPKTLCDVAAAWDTRLPLSAARCRKCLAMLKECEA